MNYIPIIKLKSGEIRCSNYVLPFLQNENIIPFFELIYDPRSKRKNTSICEFFREYEFYQFFIGIPHKPSAINASNTNSFVFKANQSLDEYLAQTLKLFDFKDSIPVFYIYKSSDLNGIDKFLNYSETTGRKSAILTTIDFLENMDKEQLNKCEYLIVDIESENLSVKRIRLNNALMGINSKIILLRENRAVTISNAVIKNNEYAPLKPDLSNEIKKISSELNFRLYGFSDFCGYKNVAATKSSQRNMEYLYPAWALYLRNGSLPHYLGIKASKPLSEDWFSELKELTIKKFEEINLEKDNPARLLINNLKMRTYQDWAIITEWNYIYQLNKYDTWVDIRVKN